MQEQSEKFRFDLIWKILTNKTSLLSCIIERNSLLKKKKSFLTEERKVNS